MRKLFYIAVEGPIGVGKTSLANLISKELGARLVLEQFEENPFLPEFYKDPERYSFQTQLFLVAALRVDDLFQNKSYNFGVVFFLEVLWVSFF